MADVKKKTRIRAGHQENHIKSKEMMENIEVENTGMLRKLKSIESELKDKLSRLKAMDNEIAELLENDEAIDHEVAESCEYVSALYDCISDVESVIETLETAQGQAKSSGSPTNLNSVHARLPKLELKMFNGNPIDWSPFWDSFQSAVHMNQSLNAVDTFNYLKSLIYGQAAETISGFSLTDENYEEAVALLKERYGNKQVLISAHVESLLKLSAAVTIETKKLRAIYDQTEAHVRSLRGSNSK